MDMIWLVTILSIVVIVNMCMTLRTYEATIEILDRLDEYDEQDVC